MNRTVLSLGCALALLSLAAGAAELPDPTRPPAALLPATTTTAAPTMAAAPALVLQSVLIGEGRTPTAIINGRVVELGAALDGLRLVRVFDGGAVLAGPRGTTTLALTPATAKVAAPDKTQGDLAIAKATRKSDSAPQWPGAGVPK